ncbi:MAG: efflux RND transporter permease subunit [Caulobacteraceae bacterium]
MTGAFQGTAQAFQESLSSMPLLILAALLSVYIILGVLYESYIHPPDHPLDAAVGRRRRPAVPAFGRS